jgi:predicted PurR-regulated permease PerM
MSRQHLSITVLAAVFVLLIILAPQILLITFAGILFAIFLRGSGDWIAERTGWSKMLGLGVFCLLCIAAIALFIALAAPALVQQFDELWKQLPEALQKVRGYVENRSWLQQAIDSIDPKQMVSGGQALTTFSTTFGALGNIGIILIVGIYAAIDPGSYLRGLVALVAPSSRPLARDMLSESGVALRGWLFAQFVSMAAIGLLTGAGLWLLGIPLAPILAVFAAVLTFVPNLGPIIAAVPAVLLGLSQGPTTALWIVGLYIVVQMIESYLITPQVQKQAVSLPPAFTIIVQVLFGVMFGLLGLALATPLAAMLLRLGDRFYVNRYLEGEPQRSTGTIVPVNQA